VPERAPEVDEGRAVDRTVLRVERDPVEAGPREPPRQVDVAAHEPQTPGGRTDTRLSPFARGSARTGRRAVHGTSWALDATQRRRARRGSAAGVPRGAPEAAPSAGQALASGCSP